MQVRREPRCAPNAIRGWFPSRRPCRGGVTRVREALTSRGPLSVVLEEGPLSDIREVRRGRVDVSLINEVDVGFLAFAGWPTNMVVRSQMRLFCLRTRSTKSRTTFSV